VRTIIRRWEIGSRLRGSRRPSKIGKPSTTIVRIASTRWAWITSVPGPREITFDALPSSPFPGHLRGLGYELAEIDGGERILASAVTERFARRADGELEPLTPDSTERVAQTVTHAGIVKTHQLSFLL
jgi:hypothetical protein